MSTREDVVKAVGEIRASIPTNSFLLSAMGLRIGTVDYEELHREGVLDGPHNKKVDFFYIDYEAGSAIIAQGYESDDWDEKDPPSNKASDLNTAVSWLLDSNLDSISKAPVRAAAEQLRDALNSGDVHTINVYYVHNAKPSKNVDDELETVEASLRNRLKPWATEVESPISATVRQLGLNHVIELYESRLRSDVNSGHESFHAASSPA